MEFQVSTSSRQPIYRQLQTQVREGVARGKLRPGDKLPSVRALSQHLVVNPNTIARAYTELEREGVLYTRQGLGVFVAEPSSDLTRSARRRQLTESADRLLTEAVDFGFTRDEVLKTLADRAEKFQWEIGA